MTATAFTDTQRTQIQTLQRELTRRTQRTVSTEYGATDCGQQWVAFNVDSLPAGSIGNPGTLVSIVAGAGIPGPAAVVSAYGRAVGQPCEFLEAVGVAKFAGMREYRAMRSGGFAVA